MAKTNVVQLLTKPNTPCSKKHAHAATDTTSSSQEDNERVPPKQLRALCVCESWLAAVAVRKAVSTHTVDSGTFMVTMAASGWPGDGKPADTVRTAIRGAAAHCLKRTSSQSSSESITSNSPESRVYHYWCCEFAPLFGVVFSPAKKPRDAVICSPRVCGWLACPHLPRPRGYVSLSTRTI